MGQAGGWSNDLLLDLLYSASGQSAQILFENELAGANDVGLHVRLPVDCAHVEIERLAILFGHDVDQLHQVVRVELPLAIHVEIQTGQRPVNFVVDSNLSKWKWVRVGHVTSPRYQSESLTILGRCPRIRVTVSMT